jgi:methyl-accepting chemotaxis protein
LTERSKLLQEEIFRIAAGAMTNEQRIELLKLCNAWSDANPGRLDVWYVQIEDLPGMRNNISGTQIISGLTSLPSEFLNIFNPFNKTQDAASEASVVAERVAWMAPRLIILAQWRAEAVVYDILAATEIDKSFDVIERLTTVAEALPQTLTDQREALFKDLADNEGTLHTLLTDTEQITEQATRLVAEADTAVNSTTELLAAADQIVARIENMQQRAQGAKADQPPPDPDAPPARPFDITEYTEAIVALNAVVQDTNDLLQTADTATAAQAIGQRVEVIEDTIAKLIWLAGGVTLGVALAIILAIKWVPSRRRNRA